MSDETKAWKSAADLRNEQIHELSALRARLASARNVLRAVGDSLDNGLECAKDCLAQHETDYGRTAPKNKARAEQMEKDIFKMESDIAAVRKEIANQ